GLYVFPRAEPVHLLYTWDVIIIAFVFFWSIGLLTELQRTETLSLSKFLHLPVSVTGAFLINYLSSLLRLSLIMFVPVMFGLALGLVFAKGMWLLLVLPLTAAFLLMVTALTYQFQGWLASLMSNPRRRRTVVVVATAIFILAFQLPNLLNVYRPWGAQQWADDSAKLVEELAALDRAFQAHEFHAQEHLRRQQEVIQKHDLARQQAAHRWAERLEHTARLTNLVLPIGWLPLGAMAAAEGNLVPPVLGLLGMTLIGSASLWRAYRTTVRLYQGEFTARSGRQRSATTLPSVKPKPAGNLVEAHLPWLSEPVSAIALGGLRSLTRSPEAKMMLLTPVLMAAIFGAMMFRRADAIPPSFRPLMAVGAMSLVLFGVLQLMCNQFGFDRDGFRVFVLCAAPRRDILLGKNLAFAPLALGMAGIVLTVFQVICPLRLDHLVAMPLLFISTYLLFCLLMNLLSILAPLPIAAGSMKPANPKLVPVLIQLTMFMFFFPFTQMPMFLPLGIEAGLAWLGWTAGLPIGLLLSLAECVAIAFFYRLALTWQGDLFQAREQKILETVANRAA
ncbi:MAG: hypothetical protein HY000_36255, partial [Planctomycetes bacterium]|nr:hypothetical protein [Planctomycetota bacterium]